MREAVALSIDRSAIQTVLLQRQGAPAAALLPQWLSGYAFLFSDARDLDRARQVAPRGAAPLTIAYDPQDASARAIADRIAVNAHEAGLTIRTTPSGQPASARIARTRIRSADANQTLSSIAAALSLDPVAPASPEALYAAERALLQGYRLVPLFHLPDIYGLGSRVRNWTATRWGVWKLDSVWLVGDKP